MFLVNGERRHCVDVSDRGFQYGDGLFETVEVLKGQPLFWGRHLKRLVEGCKRLLIPPPDLALLEMDARQLCTGVDRAVLKLIVTRGSGGRGYRQPDPVAPTRVLGLHPFPHYPDQYQSEGVVARFCHQRLAINPALAGIKHMNRLEQILARAEWNDDAVQEGLMLDCDGHVVEGTMSNLFFVKNGVLHTPELSRCGIAGIVREIVIDLAFRNNIVVLEQQFDGSSALTADEIFVTNSVIGIWPIRQLERQCFDAGRITRSFQQWYAEARITETALWLEA
ncbi:MAG: aminodeoxychorismate lyase [Methylomonas sp.]|nr:aminodeoxychorismate lyase [Methylomonas sp.]